MKWTRSKKLHSKLPHAFRVLAIFTIVLIAVSCREDGDQHTISREVVFELSGEILNGNSGGRSKAESLPTSVIVTIEDELGNIVTDHQNLPLYTFGEKYLSVPLTLASGSSRYYVTEFFVADQQQKIVFATPVEGSKYAHLVSDPLSIEFLVQENVISTVTPEVLEIDDIIGPEDFGYGQFGFSKAEKIQVVISAFVKGATNFELTNASLKIEGLTDTTASTPLWSYESTLAPKANIVALRKATAYKITASKNGYQDWTRKLILANEDALEIILTESTGAIKIWNHNYGGYQKEYPGRTFPMDDGGILMITTTSSGNGDATGSKDRGGPQGDIWIVKLDAAGTIEWKKRYGGTVVDEVRDAVAYPDASGYLITGITTSNDGDFAGKGVDQTRLNGFLLKIAPDGQIAWLTIVDQIFTDIVAATTGTNNFLLASTQLSSGEGRRDLHIRQVDEDGNKIWEKTYFQNSQTKHFYYGNLLYKSGSGYLFCGRTKMARADSQGNILWEKDLTPVTGNGFVEANARYLETVDGYFLTGCNSSSNPAYTGITISKYDQQDNKIWEKPITNATGIFGEVSNAITVRASGNYLVVGSGKKIGSPFAYSFVKEMSPNGELIKEHLFAGKGRFSAGTASAFEAIYTASHPNEFFVIGYSNDTGADVPGNYASSVSNYWDSYDIWAMKIKF